VKIKKGPILQKEGEENIALMGRKKKDNFLAAGRAPVNGIKTSWCK